MKSTLILSLVAAASAQQALYGQCGGQAWKGPTTCVAGSYCAYQNQYYSQCIAGSNTPTTMVTSVKPGPTPIEPPPPPPPAPPKSGGGSFPSRNGMLFEIDGTTKYFAGTNAYWIGFLTNNADVDLVMSHLQTSGLKVLRVWGFNDVNATPSSGTIWYQSLVPGHSPVINTGADGLQRLDHVVASAQAHGIKLIINFVNNWDAYGGMAAYSQFYGGVHNDWYTSAPIQAQYRAYIKAVVSRYADSPAIFAWELANEVRCSGCATSVITNWASSTSAYIKSLDSKHMVTLGDEGWFASGGDGSYPYQGSEGVDFVKNLAISTLDFGTYHLYPASCKPPSSPFLSNSLASTNHLFPSTQGARLTTGATPGSPNTPPPAKLPTNPASSKNTAPPPTTPVSRGNGRLRLCRTRVPGWREICSGNTVTISAPGKRPTMGLRFIMVLRTTRPW